MSPRMIASLFASALGHTVLPAQAYDCSISTTPLVFGQIEGGGQAQSSSATLTVVCHSDASAATIDYQIILDSEDPTQQRLLGAAGEIAYQLFISSDQRQLWGNPSGTGIAITDSVSLAPYSTSTRNYRVYATTRADRLYRPGSYTGLLDVRLVY